MSKNSDEKYAQKHEATAVPHGEAARMAKERAVDGGLSCAKAFKIAEECAIPPLEMGKTLDLLELRLTHCQCGLFGFPPPDKKRIKALESMPPKLEEEIKAAAEDGTVPCVDVWRIAKKLEMTRLEAACGCETLEISIRPCQLGSV